MELGDDHSRERDGRKDPDSLWDEFATRSTPSSPPTATRHCVNPYGTGSWIPGPEQWALAIVLVRNQVSDELKTRVESQGLLELPGLVRDPNVMKIKRLGP